MTMEELSRHLGETLYDYAAPLLLAAGLAGIVTLAGTIVWVRRTKKPLRPMALALSMNLALLLNAEGMWVIAVDQLDLPPIFAILVFAVFEICFLTATSLAADQYHRTSAYAPDGSIVTPGHPGPMLYIAALIAGLSGIIVASNAATGTERLLRLAVPCMIFLMWWAALTAAGQRLRRSRFAYSPRRLAERWGWLIPDDDPDLARMAAERQVHRMVVNYQRVRAARWLESWWRSRLLKDARTATQETVDEVVEQLAQIQRVMTLLAMPVELLTAPVALTAPRHVDQTDQAPTGRPDQSAARHDQSQSDAEPVTPTGRPDQSQTNDQTTTDRPQPEAPTGRPDQSAARHDQSQSDGQTATDRPRPIAPTGRADKSQTDDTATDRDRKTENGRPVPVLNAAGGLTACEVRARAVMFAYPDWYISLHMPRGHRDTLTANKIKEAAGLRGQPQYLQLKEALVAMSSHPAAAEQRLGIDPAGRPASTSGAPELDALPATVSA